MFFTNTSKNIRLFLQTNGSISLNRTFHEKKDFFYTIGRKSENNLYLCIDKFTF